MGVEKDYQTWRNEIEMWQLVTDLEKKKQAVAVALSLTGSYREVAMEVPKDDLNKDNGMETLLTKMDSAFKRETADEAYDSYEKFENERREGTTNINDFIIRFERAYNSAKKNGMNLPDSVRAYKLLKSANLNNSERHFVLSGCHKLEYETVKSALRRVFGGTGIPGGIVKEEPVFAATSGNKNLISKARGKKSFHKQWRKESFEQVWFRITM